ncbi:MAG TPA: nuclear transport factor 2 family protein [Burkholderiales bacterium]|jgi:hypothetical protein|nr:nuclear transport factor 2 family protein [Burkholderiales bacterium]
MNLTELIDRYCAAWNAAEPAERARLLAEVLSAEGSYTDPMVHAANPAALLAHIAAVREKRPGAQVLRVGEVQAHHHVARFAWEATQAGTVLRRGIDIVTLDAQGAKLTSIIGFFD